jgi:PEP-CTERM motif
MNFQELRQRGIAIGIAVLILLLWHDVLGIGAKTGAPPAAPQDPGPSAGPAIQTPGHLTQDIPAIGGALSPAFNVEQSHIDQHDEHAAAGSGGHGAPGGGFGPTNFNPSPHADLFPALDGGLGTNFLLDTPPFAGGGPGALLASLGSGGPGGGGATAGDGAGGGGVNCPMMPPASTDLFNAFAAAGCHWNEGPMEWNEGSTPPGPPSNGDGGDMAWNEDMGGSGPNSPGGTTSSIVTPSDTRAAVPEPATWLLLGLGMTVFTVVRRRRLALATSRR